MRADKTAILYFGSQVGRTLAGFIGTLYIARVLGSGTFGTYVLAIAVVTWLHIPSNAIGAAMTKRVSEGGSRSVFLGAGFVTIGALTLGIGGLLMLFGPTVESYIEIDNIKLVLALFVSQALFIFITTGLDGQKQVAQSGVMRMVEQVLRTAFQISLIMVGYDVAGLFIGHVGALLATTLVGLRLFNVGLAVPSREHFYRLIEYARYSWLSRIQSRSLDWLDTLVLGLFVPTSFIGIYEVAWTIASTLSLVTVSIATTIFPEVSELSSDGITDRIQTILEDAMRFTGLFVIPGLFGAAIIGDRVLAIYGPEFTAGITVLVVLVGTRICTSFSTLFLKILNGLDRPDLSFRIAAVFVIVNLVLNFALVATIGWLGAALATLISTGASVALSYCAVVKTIGRIELPFSTIGRQVFASGVMALIVLGVNRAVSADHYVTVGLVVVGAVVYLGTLLSIAPQIRNRLLTTIR